MHQIYLDKYHYTLSSLTVIPLRRKAVQLQGSTSSLGTSTSQSLPQCKMTLNITHTLYVIPCSMVCSHQESDLADNTLQKCASHAALDSSASQLRASNSIRGCHSKRVAWLA